ncbi:mitochondrial ribosome-associated GTPase 2-like [Littorina saxatilis]|uniref:Mitochondrial ribosome-associated GTPase 2 n=1 Tax=Littorina saxatilis TaxID=31220 RepID=A0AAN9C4M2_9CAEN
MGRSLMLLQPAVCLRAASQLYSIAVRQRLIPTSTAYTLHFCGASRAASTSATPKHIKPRKPKGDTHKVRHFVDYKQLVVRGGNGGNGCMSFSSEPCKEWAGPDGGNGGNGGHVIFEASTNSKSLAHLKPVVKAEDGIRGRTKICHGKNAEHLYIEVPVGTIIKTEGGTDIGSIEKHGDVCVVARGGAGGKGNHFFLSNENRAPAKGELGAKGQELRVKVELRTMAHAGLIGFPNAGKSTLLRAISRARPKVAAYPFTTLNPHVGIVEYDDYEQVAVADIPGLINGAHQNRGLGHSFLRHIRRCACLLYVLDLSVDEPWTQLNDLKFELEQYEEGLSKRPHAIIGNKLDVEGSEETLAELKARIDLPVFAISAKHRLGIEPLLDHLRKMYDMHVGESF